MGQLVCKECGEAYSLDEVRWRCHSGHPLDIEFKPLFPLEEIRARKPTIWRYREAIPLRDDASIISLDEGFTPLSEITLDGKSILIKQDQLFPTGSYKDRGASVLISKINELGIKEVVEDSSGNAGSAVAAYCAKAGIGCRIFVPAGTAAAKVAQIRLYGAGLNRIPGSREDTARAVWKEAEKVYYASHSWSPFFFQGTKTFAYEVCEQLGWNAPDTVILPVGHGTLLLGAAIGFDDLLGAGVIHKMPKLIGVQSENSAPLFWAFKKNLADVSGITKRETIAEGIAIALPTRGRQILEAVRKSKGDFIAVSDNEIKEALRLISRKGYYIEPTSAATIAGVIRYLPEMSPGEVIVSVFTGHGLKTTEKMLDMLKE